MADWADERAYRVVSATGLGLSGIGELIAAALRQVRADALEEAARVADAKADEWSTEWRRRRKVDSHLEGKSDGAHDCAAAIRALKESKDE